LSDIFNFTSSGTEVKLLQIKIHLHSRERGKAEEFASKSKRKDMNKNPLRAESRPREVSLGKRTLNQVLNGDERNEAGEDYLTGGGLGKRATLHTRMGVPISQFPDLTQQYSTAPGSGSERSNPFRKIPERGASFCWGGKVELCVWGRELS